MSPVDRRESERYFPGRHGSKYIGTEHIYIRHMKIGALT